MKNSRIIAWAALSLLALAGRDAAASVGPVWSIDGLTTLSRVVVTGRVVDVSAGRDIVTDGIYTHVTISVTDVLKGEVAERTITIKQLGGDVGVEHNEVADQATFTIGEDVLLFLESRPRDGTLYTASLWQGKWTLERDPATGQTVAARFGPDAIARGAFRGGAERREMTVLSDRVRAMSGAIGDRPSVRPLRLAPPAEEMAAATHRSGLAPKFVLLGSARWSEFDSRTPIGVDVMSGGQPGLSGGGANEIGRAFASWTAATPLAFYGAASSNRCFGQGTADGHISIVFNDPCGEIDDSGGTLAIGGYTSRGSRITAGYVVNNNSTSAARYLTNSSCFQTIETHEVGHTLGLGHSADSSAIMYGTISSACLSAARGLASDDVAGIQSIYQPGGSTTTTTAPAVTVPGAPTGFTTSASGAFVTMTWKAPTTGGAPSGYTIESGSAPGLSNIAKFASGSSTPGFSADKVGAGTYYVRVRAVNVAGEGPVSNESVLIVSGGSAPVAGAPGAPTNLTTTANGLFVTISWQAPSTGGAPTSYILESGSAPGLSNIENMSTGNTATTFSADKVGVGTYYVRIRASNAAGVSAPSNESVLVVR